MSKFVPVFRELATFTEVLHTQIELILVERLHHNWLKVLLPYSVILVSCCFVPTQHDMHKAVSSTNAKTVMHCLKLPTHTREPRLLQLLQL